MMNKEAINGKDTLDSSLAHQHRRRLLFLIKFAVSVGLLAFIILWADLDLHDVLKSIVQAEILFLVCAFLLFAIGNIITAVRWQGLLDSQQVNIPLYRLIQSCIVANFFKQFLPSTVGGDAIRAYDSWKMGASKSVAVVTLAVDRLLGFFALLFFAVIALTLSSTILPELSFIYLGVIGGAALLTCTILVIFLPTGSWFRPVARAATLLPGPLRKIFDKISASFAHFQGQHWLMLRSLLLSILLQINIVIFYFLIGRSLGFSIPFVAFFIIVAIATCVKLIPISINAIGIREGIFIILLHPFGIGMAEALAFAWIEYGLFLLYGIVGGIVYSLRR